MAQSLERLTRRTDTLSSIRGIVRTMKTMSAINAAPFEQAARAIDAWRETVLDGLHTFVHVAGPLPPAPLGQRRQVIVAMGSDHGLCGTYNEILAAEVARHPAARKGAHIVCVGAQLEDALQNLGLPANITLMPPANVVGLGRLSGDLATELEIIRGTGEIEVALIHTRPEGQSRQGVVTQRLLPLDDSVIADLAHRRWTSRSLPRFDMPAADLLAVLIRNLLFATLYRAAAEALMTENAARLARMQQAERSVDERLDDLKSETRAVRQNEVTSELMDVIVGFEALKRRTRRTRQAAESDSVDT